MPRSCQWHGGCDTSSEMPHDPSAAPMIIRTRWTRSHRRVLVAAVTALAVLLWASVGVAAWLFADVFTGLPQEQELRDIGTMARPTTIFDAQDRPAFTLFKEQRIAVPLSSVSPHLIEALVAVEDQRFFDHGGIDMIRVAGAAWRNLRDGWGTQGGSTLTQQLARQSFLTREKTVRRKLKEIVVAARIESVFSKDQILEWYLNKVYFGNGLYGAEAASLGYFGKHASDLNVAEAALLAGLVKAPGLYAPTLSMDRALARRHTTLEAMRSAGAIDEATLRAADAEPITLQDRLRTRETYGQYFKEEVRKRLVQQFGLEQVYEGGLQVYTTLDPEMQKVAETEVMRAVTDIERRELTRERQPRQEALQAALVAIDPATGEVRAMVGGRSFDESRFNRVTQAHRQAGSAFKPFVYAAALERGYTPATMIRSLSVPIMTLEGAWLPDDHSRSDVMTMRVALRMSSNRAAVSTLEDIGIPAAIHVAERFGIESVPGVPSLALGSGEVTLLSMTFAYAAFANGGMRPEPQLIRRVETSDGEVLFAAQPRGERAVSETTAFLMTNMLSDVVNGGTGWQARRFGFTLPAAGKTGTTNDYRDAWFIGYTPHLAAGVWVGYDQPRTIAPRGYAGTLAVPLWGRFMAAATQHDAPMPFRPPPTVVPATICRLSGKLATSACRNQVTVDENGELVEQSLAYTEYFARGTEPTEYCDWHRDDPFPGIFATSTATDRRDVPRVPVATTGTLAPASGASASAPPPPAGPQPSTSSPNPPPPERGFWGRLFRRTPRNVPAAPAPETDRPTQPSR
jgi:1A family penicillin-binding protein